MPQDSFHIRRSAQELNALLTGGKINRISQADKDEVTFIIYTGKTTVKLVLSTNASFARVCLSSTEREPAPVAPNFCMLLRKHLLGAEIRSVRQYEFERIVEITLHCVTDFSHCERVLRCELMGKYSNLILTENDLILGALKTASLEDNVHRVLLSGAKYAYPPLQDKLSPFDAEALRGRISSFLCARGATETVPDGTALQTPYNGFAGGDSLRISDEELAEFIFGNVAGLALSTAREIVRRRPETISLWDFIGKFCADEPCVPCLKTEDGTVSGKPLDFFAFPMSGGIPMPSLNKAEDEFYGRKEQKREFEDKKRKIECVVRALKKKQGKKLQDTLERLADCEEMETLRVKGELLTANLYRLAKGDKECTLENWYDPNGKSMKITLDPTLTPAQNAQKLFKSYAKQKRTLEALLPRKKQEEEEAEYTESVAASVALSETTDDLKEIQSELVDLGLIKPQKTRVGGKKKETLAPFREYSFMGFIVSCGRNNIQNDRLLKSCSPADVWLHAQKYHSAHVVIFSEGKDAPQEVLLFAAEICAYYSDGRSGAVAGGKVPVDYCLRRFVKKPPKAKAGFVTYAEYKTLLVEPSRHLESLQTEKTE